MKLKIKAFALAKAAMVTAIYVVCGLLYGLAPEPFYAFNKQLFHVDLSSVGRPIIWGGFFAGIIVVALLTGIAAALWTWCYNHFARR